MICQSCRLAMRRLPTRLPPRQFHIQPSRRPNLTFTPPTQKFYSSIAAAEEEPSMTPAESAIAELLRQKLQPTELLVRDVSGGCGSMYAIDIASPAFKGATMLKQQRMVNAALGDVMRGWHGVQLNTRVSE